MISEAPKYDSLHGGQLSDDDDDDDDGAAVFHTGQSLDARLTLRIRIMVISKNN